MWPLTDFRFAADIRHRTGRPFATQVLKRAVDDVQRRAKVQARNGSVRLAAVSRPSAHPLPRGSMAVAAFSTIVEWYDFTLYLYFATVLARVFFGPGEASLLATLGGFAIAYLMRPLGAVFFGNIGDRKGRRHMMLLSVALMTAAML